MPFDETNIQPFLDTVDGISASSIDERTNQEGDVSNESDSSIASKAKKPSLKVELIEKDGKTVSKTSTGKRKFHKKSKLGCDTCKKRRVKCDEGKPICNKCKNMGIECTYHLIAPIRKEENIEAETAAAILSSTNVSHNGSQIDSQLKASKGKPIKVTKRSKDKPQGSSMGLPGMAGLPGLAGLLSPSLIQDLMSNKIDLSKIDHPLAAMAQKFKDSLGGGGDNNNLLPDLSLPTFTVNKDSTSPQLSNTLPQQLSSTIPQIDPALSLRSSMLAHHTKDNLDRNSLSLNMHGLSHNPTISPQPSISPDTPPSPLSGNHRIRQSIHNSEQQDFQAVQTPFNNSAALGYGSNTSLNLVDLRLMYHYSTVVAPTITTAGISEQKIWSEDIPQLAFNFPFLMHSILGFSATHLSRTVDTLEQSVTYHRGEALRLLREAVLEISPENTDALVASALILIMDSLANASLPSSLSPTSLPASAWIFHVKGAATILTAVWPLPLSSRFYKFISVDLSDLGDIINEKSGSISELVCFDDSIADLYPVEYDSPYLITLAYLDKLHHEKYKSDFILRIFAFPALLDKTFLALLMSGDLIAMRIMRSYYSLLRGFTTEMKDKVWFLEGVSKVLPADVDDYTGGGGMHMMLDFLGGGLPSMTTTNLAMGLNIDINDHFMNP